MALYSSSATYEGGLPLAGKSVPIQKNAAADTYYVGMPLAYSATPTAAYVGTGNGTMTLLSATRNVDVGAWTFTFTAALVGNLADPSGNIVASAVAIADGAAAKFNFDGLAFTITDGGTAFAAGGVFTITVPAAGAYAYNATNIEAIAIEEKTLASAGTLLVLTSGSEFLESALVDGSNDTLTISDMVVENTLKNGIVLR